MNFQELGKKYTDFILPCVEIKKDKTESIVISFDDKKGNPYMIQNIQFSLSISEASTMTFDLTGCYDEENSSFCDTFKVGSVIDASIGYCSEMSGIFKGYVEEMDYKSEDENMKISITAIDAFLLMANERSAKYYEKMSKTSICKEILKKYSSLVSSNSVQISNKKEECIVREEKSDIDFIKQLCAEEEKLFYIINGEAQTKKVDFSGNADIELNLRDCVSNFSISERYDNVKFKYRALNNENFESELSCEATSKNPLQQDVISTQQINNRFIAKSLDNKHLQSIVNNDMMEHKRSVQRAVFSLVGIPEILPGKLIKVKGIKKEFDNRKYMVESVVHSIGINGYTCDVTIAGWD